MSQTADKRVLFYVQHLLGIGHLTRASRIAHALSRRGFDVTVVTGGKPVEGFPGEGVRHVALPPVVSADEGFSKLADINGEPVDDAFKAMRRDRLLSILHDIRPQAILTEAFPFGRRQMRFELLPFLDAARALPERPMIFASIRDILQKRPKPERDVETLDYVEAYFDRVLVHGDPSFVRLEETFPFAERIADKVIYTGLVAPPAPPAPSETFDVVISAGGGAVGRQMLACAVEAAAQVEAKGRWLLITGRTSRRRISRRCSRRRRPISRSPVSAPISRASCRLPRFRSRRPATTRCATFCAPAAARSSCHSPPAGKPNRPRAQTGWTGSAC